MIMVICRNFSKRGQHQHFSQPFKVSEDAVQLDVHKTLHKLLVPIFLGGSNICFAPLQMPMTYSYHETDLFASFGMQVNI